MLYGIKSRNFRLFKADFKKIYKNRRKNRSRPMHLPTGQSNDVICRISQRAVSAAGMSLIQKLYRWMGEAPYNPISER